MKTHRSTPNKLSILPAAISILFIARYSSPSTTAPPVTPEPLSVTEEIKM